MTKKQKRAHAERVAKDRNRNIRRGGCRQCGKKTARNPHTKKRYRMCPRHRAADCSRKKTT